MNKINENEDNEKAIDLTANRTEIICLHRYCLLHFIKLYMVNDLDLN